jgi:Amt family ammonium transporter
MAIDTGDTAWILVSAALVMLMTPGLAFFYGGMVRRKNILSTLMMSFSMLMVIGVLWALYGYSLAFGPDAGGIVGNLTFIGLRGVGQTPSLIYATSVPQLVFMIYQAMFAIITVALITGAVVERIRFSAILVVAIAWFTLVYAPIAHWVWGGGWLAKLGVLDFAGGSVVHLSAGISALALVLLLGKRKGFPQNAMEANNIPFVVLGAGILWFGWFGFNAGSALSSGGLAGAAFVNTSLAGSAAGLVWMLLAWVGRKPAVLGGVTGSIVGLAAVTPASGYITPMAALAIGGVASCLSYWAMIMLKGRVKLDDSLDVFACHGVGGAWGMLATGIFATLSVNQLGADGLITGSWVQLGRQLIGIAAVGGYAFISTLVIGKAVDFVMGLRVSQVEETVGLDIAQHGERAYGGLLR